MKKRTTRLASPQFFLDFQDELIIDNFAGGGGATEGIEQGIGRPVDIAINHNPKAVAMHAVNHPDTKHYCQDVWTVDPREVAKGRPIGLAWFSPDCTHHSKAKGGKPRSKKIRDLAWVVIRWAAAVRPRVIMLENVEEFKDWGPLTENGKPCKKRKGTIFRHWLEKLKSHGYNVEYRELRACDYGAPTIRKRLFLVARCDGKPITWPEPTHGTGLIPYRTAADCIDWSLPCPSIFLTKEQGKQINVRRPLAENTLKRIAKGIERYVIQNPNPFIVSYYGPKKNGEFRGCGMHAPLPTQTTENRFGLVVPYTVPRYSERPGQEPRTRSIESPLATIVTTNNQSHLVGAFLAKHYGGVVGHEVTRPAGTVTTTDHHSVVTSNLAILRNNCSGADIEAPLNTVTSSGHFAEVRAFLIKYYNTNVGHSVNEPAHTITTNDRLGLVTVKGIDYAIIDIGMRMLSPRELFRAQGFNDDYVIDPEFNGKPLTKTDQVHMCGNSVSPVIARALVTANCTTQKKNAAA